ncbi:BTAD domain-containing putative transcriptional regulator [Belnapia rosea]|uniref:DNA-binding transcriptional activator of the SARP family n=1 Tax=Belnapia rosea TaxID=938405 RepID=A0A1G6ZLZ3_9PROT|nr:BTAD domain-containing putative transcriptional regulator [Belnapia rosea]SDB67074.1 DNA-binding transcriptional activator of the SARP family [Belnapia rosea]SDE03492.1 DNA-binding transcriptional activator of the SARP family [Belnapia rosea]
MDESAQQAITTGGRAAQAAPALLQASLFGPLRATFAGQELRLRSRKARALLGYLLMTEGGEESRERLVGLLWSETGEDKARASLRQVVHELREAMETAGCDALRAGRLTICLDLSATQPDARDVLRAAERGIAHPLLLSTPRLSEALLQGLDDLDPAYRGWLSVTRQAFHDRLIRALESAMRVESQPRSLRQRLAEAILRLDPTHEEACRDLMRHNAEAGDTVGALRAYDQLWHLLEEEYDTEPSAATQALVADIKLGRIAPVAPGLAGPPVAEAELEALTPAPVPRPAGTPSRIALLVEPFAVNGVGPDQMHLALGFRHDLIACLVRFREWFVIDGPAMPSAEQTGNRVSARYRISATAYQVGDRISLVLTLAEQDSGIFIWSERMELRLDGWFEAHRDIVRRIAIALNLQISSSRLQRLAVEADVSLESYDRWLRATAMIRSFSPQNWARAGQLFRECIERTPGFSSAYSGLAQMENSVHIIHPGERRSREREARAVELARRAVHLDPTDSRAQLTLGWSLAMSGQHAQAEVPMRLACELNPNDSWTLISTALFHSFAGNHDRAAELAAQSLEMTLMPSLTHWGYQVTIAYLRGDDAATLEACDRAQDVIRTLPAWRAAALARLGREEAAAEAAQRYLQGVREAWFAEAPPSDLEMVRWLLHLYPIRRAEEWMRLRDGIAAAGLPTFGARHGDW